VRLAERIELLLAEKVATQHDDSLLAGALGGAVPSTLDERAFHRVEVLLAAWEEMHREAKLAHAVHEEGWNAYRRMQAALRGDPCANCGQGIGAHALEDDFGYVCPTDAAPRTGEERFTYWVEDTA
jgi:hypothetical protein